MELINIKRTKKIFVLIISLLFLFSCNNNKPNNKNNQNVYNTDFPSEFVGITNSKKIYLTSFGQSKDIEDLGLFLFKNKSIEYYQDNDLNVNNVEDGSIVFAVVGCSIKGLEAQNTTISEEIKRCNSFAEANRIGKITLITWHIGGMARRGTTSDEIIKLALEGSSLVIYVISGNTDNYLTEIVTEKNIPSYAITSITLLNKPIEYLNSFSLEEK